MKRLLICLMLVWLTGCAKREPNVLIVTFETNSPTPSIAATNVTFDSASACIIARTELYSRAFQTQRVLAWCVAAQDPKAEPGWLERAKAWLHG